MNRENTRVSSPAVTDAAAAAGPLLGAALGTRRRPSATRQMVKEIGCARRALGRLRTDLHAVHEQVDRTRQQSPIDVGLSALMSRRLPRPG